MPRLQIKRSPALTYMPRTSALVRLRLLCHHRNLRIAKSYLLSLVPSAMTHRALLFTKTSPVPQRPGILDMVSLLRTFSRLSLSSKASRRPHQRLRRMLSLIVAISLLAICSIERATHGRAGTSSIRHRRAIPLFAPPRWRCNTLGHERDRHFRSEVELGNN
jgi:hypothetical protein